MKKLFYTDPLAAVYMSRTFKVKYTDDYYVEMMHQPVGLRPGYIIPPAFIHPDSYRIFEPQVGDLISEAPFCAIQIGDEGFANRVKERRVHKIIQRNNKPFFWPESEEA